MYYTSSVQIKWSHVPTPIVITKKDLMVEESQELRHLAVQFQKTALPKLWQRLKRGQHWAKRNVDNSDICWFKAPIFWNLPEVREPGLVSTYCIIFCYCLPCPPLNKAFSQWKGHSSTHCTTEDMQIYLYISYTYDITVI